MALPRAPNPCFSLERAYYKASAGPLAPANVQLNQ